MTDETQSYDPETGLDERMLRILKAVDEELKKMRDYEVAHGFGVVANYVPGRYTFEPAKGNEPL